MYPTYECTWGILWISRCSAAASADTSSFSRKLKTKGEAWHLHCLIRNDIWYTAQWTPNYLDKVQCLEVNFWMSDVILLLFLHFNCVDWFKGYFQGQKGLIWTFVNYWGQYLQIGTCLYEALLHFNVPVFDSSMSIQSTRHSPSVKYILKCLWGLEAYI